MKDESPPRGRLNLSFPRQAVDRADRCAQRSIWRGCGAGGEYGEWNNIISSIATHSLLMLWRLLSLLSRRRQWLIWEPPLLSLCQDARHSHSTGGFDGSLLGTLRKVRWLENKLDRLFDMLFISDYYNQSGENTLHMRRNLYHASNKRRGSVKWLCLSIGGIFSWVEMVSEKVVIGRDTHRKKLQEICKILEKINTASC